jgi:hypothetical protein
MPAHDPYSPVGWVDETTGQVVPLEDEFDPERDNVPDGTVDEVKAWVGDDPARAELALLAEGERSHPRVTLIDHLDGVLEAHDDDPVDDEDDGEDDDDPLVDVDDLGEADSSPGDALLGVPGPDDAAGPHDAPEGA